METAWESEIAAFLAHLSDVQKKTLDVLARKGRLLAAADTAGLAALEGDLGGRVARLPGHLDRALQRAQRVAVQPDRDGWSAVSR